MKCTCGATLPINNRYSICDTCLNEDVLEDFHPEDDYEPDNYEQQELEYFEAADEYYGQFNGDYGD